MRRRSLRYVLASLAGVGLAGLAAEGALVLGGIVAARQANPRPYWLTHALAGGTLAIGLGTLAAARRGVGAGGLPWHLAPNPQPPTPNTWAATAAMVGLVGYGFYLEPRWVERVMVEVELA